MGINDDDMPELCDDIRTYKSLTSLSLALNQIGVTGSRILGEVCRDMRTLTSLSLSYNCLGTEGARILARVLAPNCQLKTLQVCVLCVCACVFGGRDCSVRRACACVFGGERLCVVFGG